MKIICVVLISLYSSIFLSGCSEKEDQGPGIVEHMTGSEHIKNYKNTKSKLEDINKSLEERYQDID